jgi:hypothetical protein
MIDDSTLRSTLKSQYHAALAMLRETIERCPEDLWSSAEHLNAFWQLAYHTLFYTHLYLQPDEASFLPWEHHQSGVQNEDGLAGPPNADSTLPLIPQRYSRDDVLAYWDVCNGLVDGAIATTILDGPSGFFWYKVSKLELQFINIRHIQHHTAQLADRLRSANDIGTQWVGSHYTSQ